MKSKILKKACIVSSAIAVATVMSIGTASAEEHKKAASLSYIASEINTVPFCDVLSYAEDATPSLLPGSIGTMFTFVETSLAGQMRLQELSRLYEMTCMYGDSEPTAGQ